MFKVMKSKWVRNSIAILKDLDWLNAKDFGLFTFDVLFRFSLVCLDQNCLVKSPKMSKLKKYPHTALIIMTILTSLTKYPTKMIWLREIINCKIVRKTLMLAVPPKRNIWHCSMIHKDRTSNGGRRPKNQINGNVIKMA